MGNALEVLDEVVSYIPVVGTVKDTTQGIVYLIQGDTEKANEKMRNATIGIATDALTLATFGAGAVAGAAAKTAARVGGNVAISMATKECAAAGGKALGKAAANQAGKSVTQQAAAGALALGTMVRAKTIGRHDSGEEREKKRGDHVINNGVRYIFREIIDEAIGMISSQFQGGPRNMGDLLTIYPSLTGSSIFQCYNLLGGNNPLDNSIIGMVTFSIPANEPSVNAECFGFAKRALVSAGAAYMSRAFFQLREHPGYNVHDLHIWMQHFTVLRGNLDRATSSMLNGNYPDGEFVDQLAKRYWFQDGYSQFQFSEVHYPVQQYLSQLSQGNIMVDQWVVDLSNAVNYRF